MATKKKAVNAGARSWIVLGRENGIGDIGVGFEDESAAPVAVALDRGNAEETRSNAALISAAPELAAALLAMVERYGTFAPGKAFSYPADHLIFEARAVLLKAGLSPSMPPESA